MAKYSNNEVQFITDEYVKILSDISYFAENYCKVLDKDASKYVDFKLYPFQKTTLNIINKKNKSIILKARQMGISAISVLLCVYYMVTKENFKIIVVSNKQATSDEFLKKVKEMYESIPEFIKSVDNLQFGLNNSRYFELTNGSSIHAKSSNPDSSRGLPANLVIFDEMAFCANAEEVVKAISPTLSKDGKIIMLSTPATSSGYFFDHWNNAVKNKNGYEPIKLKYDLHPKYDEEWAREKRREVGDRAFEQEHCCEFGNTGDGAFTKGDIEYYEKNTKDNPKYTYGEFSEFWVWEEPLPAEDYAVIVDTATGHGKDSSTIQIMKLSDSSQVLEYEGSFDPKRLALEAVSLAVKYNKAMLIIENTGIGFSTVNDALYIGYDNLYKGGLNSTYNYESYVDGQYNEQKSGFSMNWSSRPMVMSKFFRAIETKMLKIRSGRTINELKTLIWLKGKAQASYGASDDLIMPLAIYSYLIDTVLVYANRARDMSGQMVNAIQMFRPNSQLKSQAQIEYENIIQRFELDGYDIYN
jgi:hypothetical protein